MQLHVHASRKQFSQQAFRGRFTDMFSLIFTAFFPDFFLCGLDRGNRDELFDCWDLSGHADEFRKNDVDLIVVTF